MKQSDHVVIFGGGTFDWVDSHFATSAPAFGATARKLDCFARMMGIPSTLVLTKMADHTSNIVTNVQLLDALVDQLARPEVTHIIFNAAVCDFALKVRGADNLLIPAGKNQPRLSSRERGYNAILTPLPKLLQCINESKGDKTIVGFKNTFGADRDEMVRQGRRQMQELKTHYCFVNDGESKENLLVGCFPPRLHAYMDRETGLKDLLKTI